MKRILKLILALAFVNTLSAQVEPNDCVNALTVCGSGTFFSNAGGIGNTQEINACGGFENNSLWLKITIAQAGTLGFNLIPDDPDIGVDYDFWVFPANATCGALGSPIRCATTNPVEAGLTSNVTGMNGTMLITQTGPGSDGNGFVRWLNVLPGQSYYIAIDRPVGDGGFQLQWTGTATTGAGAFPTPPTANSISDLLTCSNTPNVGIYNLNTVRPLINADTVNNTITFHTSIADASDNINALPNIYANTSNPQTIYVRVTNNASGCYTITDFDLVVNLVPNASVSISDPTICIGNSTSVTFTGTPNATFNYTVNGGPTQTQTLNAAGTYSIIGFPAADTTYTLTGVKVLDASGATICEQVLNQSVTVTVIALPTATISGSTSTCTGGTAVITFTGTPNATVTYTVNGGANQDILLDATGTASLTTPALSVNTTYDLVSVVTAGTPACSQAQTGSATITIITLPTATISGTTTICSGNTATITFNGTPNATVTYTVDGGADQTVVLGATGTATVTTGPLTANSTYDLVSVAMGGSSTCNQAQTGSATITVVALPTAIISGTTTICSGNTATITFVGTPNATVTYTVNLGTDQTINLNAAGTATLTTLPLTANSIYDLVSVAITGASACSQTLTGSAIITVNPLPTATISGTTSVCPGSTATITFNGTPNATVTYTINGGANQTILLNAAGTATHTTLPLSADTTYNLVSVTAAGTPVCSQTQTGSAVITVIALPTATISGTGIICSGNTATITFNGTPNATVTYTVDGGANETITLSAAGSATLTTPALLADSTYDLVSVATSGTPSCSQNQTGSATITVTALPTATISGTTTICAGNTATITFNGTPNATVTYTINGGANQTILLNATGTATFTTTALLPGINICGLVDVTIGSCSQTLTGSATITVNALPVATISGTTSVCPGSTATITFNGTPNATVTYTINGGANQTVLLNAAGTATHTTLPLSADTTYSLVSVTAAGTPVCSQTQTGSAVITVIALPTATISGTTSICSGNTATITFNGTPNATITYTVNGGTNQNVLLNASGTASLTPTLSANTIYNLVSVSTTGTPACSQPQTGSATVTVIALPTATISGTTAICVNSPSPSITITGANGTAPYTFTYSLNNVTQPTVTTASGNSVTIPLTATAAGTYTYSLISVQGSGVGTCSQAQSGTATVTINPLPNATIAASVPSVCLNSSSPTVTLTGSIGTAPYTFVYTQNGSPSTVTSTGNTHVLTVPTNAVGPVNYELVSVTDANGCSQNINQTATITILDAPIINVPPPYAICEDAANCFDLAGVVAPQVTTDATLNVSFHLSAGDALTGTAPLASPYCITSAGQTIHIRVFDPNAPGCPSTTTVQLIINPLPEVTLEDGHICVDPVTHIITGAPYQLQTGLSTANHTFAWFNESGQIPLATNSFYNATTAGQYHVEITNTTTGCFAVSNTATVVTSSPPVQISYVTTNYFAENASVTITAEPVGNYEYQIDNGPFQSSNVFDNLGAGLHTIGVRDIYGCDILEETFRIIDYPKYFTPNGDGYHDFWNISLFDNSIAEIQIFDRYGKLLKMISTNGQGWDGTYNGNLLPSTDYWFTISYVEQSKAKVFRAHFTLKR